MKFDHAYIVVKDLSTSVEFYSKIFESAPAFQDAQWADWGNQKDRSYFGVMSTEGYGNKDLEINPKPFPVMVFSSDSLESDTDKVKKSGGKIVVDVTSINTDDYQYSYFWFKDPDGYIIEAAQYKFN